jgi:hypothetical protein
MEKLFAGAAAAAVLVAGAPAWAIAPDGLAPSPAFEPPAETITARAHLIFANANTADPPVVGDLTVIQEGVDFAVVKTSFTTTAGTAGTAGPASAVLPCPPARAKTASAKKIKG